MFALPASAKADVGSRPRAASEAFEYLSEVEARVREPRRAQERQEKLKCGNPALSHEPFPLGVQVHDSQ